MQYSPYISARASASAIKTLAAPSLSHMAYAMALLHYSIWATALFLQCSPSAKLASPSWRRTSATEDSSSHVPAGKSAARNRGKEGSRPRTPTRNTTIQEDIYEASQKGVMRHPKEGGSPLNKLLIGIT